jgi:ATP synthase protein I
MARPPNTKRPPDGEKHDPLTSDLAERIARARADRQTENRPPNAAEKYNASAMAKGFRLASEFVAAIIVGAGLGYGVDFIFHTTPWGLVILLLLGFAAGVLNVIRATAEMNAAPNTSNAPSVTDDDDE